MNERIRELAEEAELRATLLFNKENLEKFAELIVRECAPFVGAPGSKAVEKMMKHFGIK